MLTLRVDSGDYIAIGENIIVQVYRVYKRYNKSGPSKAKTLMKY